MTHNSTRSQENIDYQAILIAHYGDTLKRYSDTDYRLNGGVNPICGCSSNGDTNTPPTSFNFPKGVVHCHKCGNGGHVYEYCKQLRILPEHRKMGWGVDFKDAKPAQKAKHFHDKLLNSPDAIKTIETERGLTLETITKYKLGIDREGRITIPILQGRAAFNVKHHKGPQTTGGKATLYPELVLAEIKNGLHKVVVIAEGEFKALLLLQMGITAISPTGGAGTWKAGFTNDLKHLDRIVIAYDNDQAGLDGTKKVATAFEDKGKPVYSIQWPPEMVFNDKSCKDVADYIVKLKRTKEDFLRLVQEAKEVEVVESGNDKTVLPSYFDENGKPIYPYLANHLMSILSFVHIGGVSYVYQDGVYVPKGQDTINMECRTLIGKKSSNGAVYEVAGHIEAFTKKEPNDLNTHQELINVKNGMLDFAEERLIKHDPSYLSTIQLPLIYNPTATCPVCDHFFQTTLPPDCIDLAYELLGLCLVPYVSFEKAFMLTGSGANGKSTFLSLLECFIGHINVSKVPLQDLDGHRFKRAELYGKLVNLFADLSTSALITSSYFKTVVSGDSIDAERKGKDVFFFKPFARLIFSANELPRSYDKSFAYYRRWVIIPFDNTFTGKHANKNLLTELTTERELSGLLNHALRGLIRLFDRKDFLETESTKNMLEGYKKQNDSVHAFIADMCNLNVDGQIERTALYTAYLTYCDTEHLKPINRADCYNRIRAIAQVRDVKLHGEWFLKGIVLGES